MRIKEIRKLNFVIIILSEDWKAYKMRSQIRDIATHVLHYLHFYGGIALDWHRTFSGNVDIG